MSIWLSRSSVQCCVMKWARLAGMFGIRAFIPLASNYGNLVMDCAPLRAMTMTLYDGLRLLHRDDDDDV